MAQIKASFVPPSHKELSSLIAYERENAPPFSVYRRSAFLKKKVEGVSVVCVKRGREGRKEEPSPLFLPREKVGRKREEERYIAPPISAKPLSPHSRYSAVVECKQRRVLELRCSSVHRGLRGPQGRPLSDRCSPQDRGDQFEPSYDLLRTCTRERACPAEATPW